MAGQSHLTLKTKNPHLEVPSKLLEVAEVVGNLVEKGLVEDQLMGPALRAWLAEIESQSEARSDEPKEKRKTRADPLEDRCVINVIS